MKLGYSPIALDKYLALHMRANPATRRTEVEKQLQSAVAAARAGARCSCGDPIWIVGSVQVGHGCFTCITGETAPSGDYEIEISPDAT
jgi:hypothetical protein